jgi:hypothetical protein
MIKAGTRLRSQVCETQVIIVKSAESLADLRAGGAPMVGIDAEIAPHATLDPDFAGGSVLGKRYIGDGGAEVLVTKAGRGTLSLGDAPLQLKEANPLPASD